MKRFIQGSATRHGWELNHLPCDHGRRKNDASNHYATLTTNIIEELLGSKKYRFHILSEGFVVWIKRNITKP